MINDRRQTIFPRRAVAPLENFFAARDAALPQNPARLFPGFAFVDNIFHAATTTPLTSLLAGVKSSTLVHREVARDRWKMKLDPLTARRLAQGER